LRQGEEREHSKKQEWKMLWPEGLLDRVDLREAARLIINVILEPLEILCEKENDCESDEQDGLGYQVLDRVPWENGILFPQRRDKEIVASEKKVCDDMTKDRGYQKGDEPPVDQAPVKESIEPQGREKECTNRIMDEIPAEANVCCVEDIGENEDEKDGPTAKGPLDCCG